jgi:hypothetical protein
VTGPEVFRDDTKGSSKCDPALLRAIYEDGLASLRTYLGLDPDSNNDDGSLITV